MKKILLSAAVVALASATALAQDDAIVWGDWQEMATSSVTFPEGEFIYEGVVEEAPTFYREASDESGRAQYRFDNVFYSNTSDVKGSLVVDVFEDGTIGVLSQEVPSFDLSGIDPDLAAWYPGPFAVCDFAEAMDMPFYRWLNEYSASPLGMSLYMAVYDTNSTPMEGMICSGTIEIKTNAKPVISLPSTCVIGGDQSMGLLKVETDESVWGIKYALLKGELEKVDIETYETYTVIDKILEGDENLVIMNSMAGDLMATPMEGPGQYTLGAVAYDENDKPVGSATCSVFYMPTESWNWKPLGKAKVTEDFLANPFEMNIENAGIEIDGPAKFEVDVEESNSTPGLYRLVNMYGPSHPYSAMFEYVYDFPVYTYIDCTNEAGCYIYDMPTGFIAKGDTSGEMRFGSQISLFENTGWPMDQMEELGLSVYFGTKEDKTITFTADQIALFIPVFAEYFGEGWYAGDICTDNDFVVELPAGTGVESVAVKSEKPEYFNLNGVRVNNPAKGGIYIMRTGDKVEKVVK